MRVADRAETIIFVGALIVDDGETEVQVWSLITLGPLFEVTGELCVRDDVRVIDRADGRDIVDDVLEHRLPGHRQQRLRLIQCQWIKARRIPRREND